jgi:hypothetical protein
MEARQLAVVVFCIVAAFLVGLTVDSWALGRNVQEIVDTAFPPSTPLGPVYNVNFGKVAGTVSKMVDKIGISPF